VRVPQGAGGVVSTYWSAFAYFAMVIVTIVLFFAALIPFAIAAVDEDPRWALIGGAVLVVAVFILPLWAVVPS